MTECVLLFTQNIISKIHSLCEDCEEKYHRFAIQLILYDIYLVFYSHSKSVQNEYLCVIEATVEIHGVSEFSNSDLISRFVRFNIVE